MRSRQHVLLGAVLFLGLFYLSIFRIPFPEQIPQPPVSNFHFEDETIQQFTDSSSSLGPVSWQPGPGLSSLLSPQQASKLPPRPPPPSSSPNTNERPEKSPFNPVAPPENEHPIPYLIRQAEQVHNLLVSKQSRNLSHAVAEYKRRYRIPPPPGFDKWFAFAQSRHVVLVDEFDDVHDMLLPFWGLKPRTIRQRAREMLASAEENRVMGLRIRRGKIQEFVGARWEWFTRAVGGMTQNWLALLGQATELDLDLVINLHDEPRIVVPSDDLDRLVESGRAAQGRLRAKAEKEQGGLRTKWTRVLEGEDGNEREEEEARFDHGTRFNVLGHQQTWYQSRMSCPPDSPARSLDDDDDAATAGQDYASRWAISELGFVRNVTAHGDICYHPSARTKHGLFVGANAFNVAHDLMPVFSQSKISSFQDMLLPSPWYWNGNAKYEEWRDPLWEEKRDSLFWRGSTTGGFAKGGNWKAGHRMRFVERVNRGDVERQDERILVPSSDLDRGRGGAGNWGGHEVQSTSMGHHSQLFDVLFSEIGQCDAADCAAMREAFRLGHYEDRQVAWQHKYLLDMDGNAFSGRFYAFLHSRSLVFKMGVFREWHGDTWLRPWLHYVPLGLDGGDWLEGIRWFAGRKENGHEDVGKRLGGLKQEWAGKALRKEDMESWFFRLVLEYARVVDEGREWLGFVLRDGEEDGRGDKEG